MVAKTGRGKEGGIEGIDRIITAMTPLFPNAEKIIGAASFASGQGMTKTLDTCKCYLSVLNEIGTTLKSICDPKAPPHLNTLRQMWLDLYSKSGWNKHLRPTVYSDSDKNTASIQAPNISILGDSAPDTFFDWMGVEHIRSGFIPRVSVVEYTGKRHGENPQAFHNPPHKMVIRLAELAHRCQTMAQNNTNCNILQDAEGQRLMKAFGDYADTQINDNDDTRTELWNRAKLKALKLAGLVAVGCGYDQPIVTGEIAQWAIDFVKYEVSNMVSKFSNGEVGEGDHKQAYEVKRVIDAYQTLKPEQRISYKVPDNLSKLPELIPYVFLRQRLFQLASFKNDRRGAREAIQKSLDELVKAGILTVMPAPQAMSTFQTSAPLYMKGPSY